MYDKVLNVLLLKANFIYMYTIFQTNLKHAYTNINLYCRVFWQTTIKEELFAFNGIIWKEATCNLDSSGRNFSRSFLTIGVIADWLVRKKIPHTSSPAQNSPGHHDNMTYRTSQGIHTYPNPNPHTSSPAQNSPGHHVWQHDILPRFCFIALTYKAGSIYITDQYIFSNY